MHFRQQNREDYSAEGEWHARKHGGPKRRVWRKIHLGIDEETLEVRAVEITGSHIGDAPVLPDLLSQIPVMKRSGASRLTVPTTPATVTTPSPTGVPWLSSRPERMPNPGSQSQREPSHATRPCGHPNTWAARSGETGANTTAGAVPKPRCTA